MKTLVYVVGVAVCGLLSASFAFAQRSQPQEIYKILGISVDGNSLADPGAIIANSGLKLGDEITVPGDQVSQAIRKLWSLRIFEDIQIGIDRKVGQGAYLLITVREFPRYERTDITGNDELSNDDIMKKVNLVRGQVFPLQDASRIR